MIQSAQISPIDSLSSLISNKVTYLGHCYKTLSHLTSWYNDPLRLAPHSIHQEEKFPPTFKASLLSSFTSTVWENSIKIDTIGQQNRIESPEINLSILGQLIFDKSTRNTQETKKNLSFERNSEPKWCCETWITTYKRIKLNPYIVLYTKINSTWSES